MKQMTFRAREKRFKRQVRRSEWSRLMKNPSPIDITEVWNLNDYTAKYIAPRLKMLKKNNHRKGSRTGYTCQWS